MNKNLFTIRLANGKQQTFETAAEMAFWINNHRPYRSDRRGNSRTKTTPNQSLRQRSSNDAALAEQQQRSPLARYANRHSGEA